MWLNLRVPQFPESPSQTYHSYPVLLIVQQMRTDHLLYVQSTVLAGA